MVAQQTTDTNYLTSLLSITRDNYLKKLQDNIFDEHATLNLISKKSQVMMQNNGYYITIPLMLAANSTTDSYDGYDVVDTTPQRGFLNGQSTWAHYAVSISVSHTERQANRGESAVVDLLASKMMQAEESLKERLNGDLYLDGTGNAGKNLTGLLSMIPTSATPGAYLGLTHADWTHQYQAGAIGTLATMLQTLYYSMISGNDQPDIITTDALGMSEYEDLNRTAPVGIYYTKAELADFGFASLAYKGIPMVLDQNAPQYSTTLPIYHMLNSKYLGFEINDIDLLPFERSQNQIAKTAFLIVDCELVTSNRRRQGKVVCTS